MNEQRGEVNIGRYSFTWQEIVTGVLLLAAACATIVGIVGNNTTLYLSSILSLLLTFVLYTFFFMRQTDTKLDTLHKSLGTVNTLERHLIDLRNNLSTIGKLELIVNPDDVFHFGCSAIEAGKKQGGWDMVRIYAPIGLWDPSKTKDNWLEALQFELGIKSKGIKPGCVRGFKVMYSLPSSKEAFDNHAERRLRLFKYTYNTEIHYLPPEDNDHPTPAPGVGAIIFENTRDQRYVVIFAYVGKSTDDTDVGKPTDDTNSIKRNGFVLKDSEAGMLLATWFDDQIFEGCSRTHVLRGHDPNDRTKWVDFETELAKIRKCYYPE